MLDRYEDQGSPISGGDRQGLDSGWFRKPIFLLLNKLYGLAGNFGVAIILLTLIVRGIMFPGRPAPVRRWRQ